MKVPSFFLLTLVHLFLFLHCHGDTEPNPGPRNIKKSSVLNSLSAHNFSKLTKLKANNSTYKYDFINLSETCFDSSIPDSLLNIDGYNLVRADHPDDVKRGGVCICYKESLPVSVISLSYINEAILLEMHYNNKQVIVSVIYRSPSQNNQEFDSFLTNFQNY